MKTIRLQYLAELPITNGLGLPGEHADPDWPRYVRTTDIASPRQLRRDVFASQPPLVAAAAPLHRNDIVACAAGATIGKSLLYEEDSSACYAGFLVRFRPGSQTDALFISYWMQSAHYWAQIETGAVRSTIDNFSASKYRALRAPHLSLEEQRRIAEFLDDRVARIDQIIAARSEQLLLVRERAEAELQDIVDGLSGGLHRRLQDFTDPLRRIQYGIVLPGPDFEGGVPIIKGGDIGSGRLGRMELNRTDPMIESHYVRSRVTPGDFVIAIRGSVGEIASVPVGLEGANLTQDSARIAPVGCDPGWLHAVLQTPQVQAEMESLMTGSTVRGINIEALRRVTIPVASSQSQEKIATEADAMRRATMACQDGLSTTAALLAEYKQSLITAAVTGEFDVTTASTRVPGG